MYKNVLVPIALDHSRDTKAALDIARRLASDGGSITAFNVIEEIPAYVANYMPEGHAQTVLAETRAELEKALGNASHVEVIVVRGHAGRTIVEYATKHDVDCIVIASHRPGLQDYFIGSTATRVVRHAPCAVHVIR